MEQSQGMSPEQLVQDVSADIDKWKKEMQECLSCPKPFGCVTMVTSVLMIRDAMTSVSGLLDEIGSDNSIIMSERLVENYKLCNKLIDLATKEEEVD